MSSDNCLMRSSLTSGVAIAAPKRVGARLTTAFIELTAAITSGAATIIPVRTPGRPILDRLKQRIVLSSQFKVASE